MKILDFDWDGKNLNHIARHSVNQEEVEEAFISNPLIRRGTDKYYYAYGRTTGGRYLFTVFFFKGKGIVRTVTSRDMEKEERRLYKRKRRNIIE